MKLAILAALAAFAFAGDNDSCEQDGFDQKCTPDSLRGTHTKRYGKEVTEDGKRQLVFETGLTRQELRAEVSEIDNRDGKRTCKKGYMRFQKYCHGHPTRANKTPKYADWRLDDGSCDHEESLAELQCLGMQCMFEYCTHLRDEWLDECVENNGDQDDADWGEVYNFGNMHGDLASNGGDWANATCDDYYELKAEMADELDDLGAEDY